MSRSSVPQLNGTYPHLNPQIQELFRQVMTSLDCAIQESQEFETPQEVYANKTLQHALSSPEETSFKDFFKNHFHTQSPPVDIKQHLLEKINQLNS